MWVWDGLRWALSAGFDRLWFGGESAGERRCVSSEEAYEDVEEDDVRVCEVLLLLLLGLGWASAWCLLR